MIQVVVGPADVPRGPSAALFGGGRRRPLVQVGVEDRLKVPVARRGQPGQRVRAGGLEPFVAVLLQ